MQIPSLQDEEFQLFRRWLYRSAGINLSPGKKALVAGRLGKRLRHHGLGSYGDYFRLIMAERGGGELQTALDLLTTNETYFFREPRHFDFLRQQVLPALGRGRPVRLWSAACSSGEEPYSLAMTLAEALGAGPWELVASDISSRVLAQAGRGQYPLSRAEHIDTRLLHKYCLKGVGEQEGSFLVERRLRQRIRFMQINLNQRLPEIGDFDVIFLRNVMIYFDLDTKRQVVERILPRLRPGGYFIVSHSESLNGVSEALRLVQPSIYRKP